MDPASVDRALLIFDVFAFWWGAMWGSFLNVVIYRLPAGMSLVRPSSRCPHCETPIRFYDNVPVLSWIFLRGRCRTCKGSISIRYPAIELLMGLLSLALFVHIVHGRFPDEELHVLAVPFLFYFAFLAALVAVSFIDLDTTELPPSITIPGIAVGIVAALLIPKTGSLATLTPAIFWENALLGAGIGGGGIFFVIVIYYVLTGRAGMGGGDLWLMAMCGAFLGWQSLLFLVFASSFQGVLASGLLVVYQKIRGEPERHAFFRDGAEWSDVPRVEADASRTDRAEEPTTAGEPTDRAEELTTAGEPTDRAEESTTAGEPTDRTEEADSESVEFRKLAVPFGPFIALAALEYLFLGHILLPLMTADMLYPGIFVE